MPLLPQCVEIFLLPPLEGKLLQVEFSNLQDIFIGTKSCWEYFWFHLKKKQDDRHGHFLTFCKEFCYPTRAKGIIGRDFKIAGYVQDMAAILNFTKKCIYFDKKMVGKPFFGQNCHMTATTLAVKNLVKNRSMTHRFRDKCLLSRNSRWPPKIAGNEF